MTTTVAIQAKPFWKSWTFWFNLVALLGLITDWLVAQNFSFVTEGWFLGVVAVINMILRFKSERPVSTSTKTVDVKRVA